MLDYSIEFAHTYIDETWSQEHLALVKKTKEIIHELESKNKTYSLVVMIDDYNPESDLLNKDDLIQKLKENMLEPDFVILESEVTKIGERVFELLEEGKLKRSYQNYIERKNHYPCSFLIVGWYALRLGLVELDGVNFYYKSNKKDLVASKLLNILQSRYKDPESKANNLISISSFSDKIESIQDIFIEEGI